MSIRQINQSHRYSNVKYIVKSHNMFGIYHRMRFRLCTNYSKISFNFEYIILMYTIFFLSLWQINN